MEIAEVIVTAVAAYALVGVLFGLAFVSRGVHRLDPSAVGASWRFRLIILPGAAALWPLLLSRWLTGAALPEERTAHTRAARREAGS